MPLRRHPLCCVHQIVGRLSGEPTKLKVLPNLKFGKKYDELNLNIYISLLSHTCLSIKSFPMTPSNATILSDEQPSIIAHSKLYSPQYYHKSIKTTGKEKGQKKKKKKKKKLRGNAPPPPSSNI